MLDKLRSLTLGLNVKANAEADIRDTRRLVVSTAKLARKNGELKNTIDGIAQVEVFLNAEHSSWIGHPVFNARIKADFAINAGFDGEVVQFEGVAFRTMPHVIMADPATWSDDDRTGCILSFDDVAELAAKTTADVS